VVTVADIMVQRQRQQHRQQQRQRKILWTIIAALYVCSPTELGPGSILFASAKQTPSSSASAAAASGAAASKGGSKSTTALASKNTTAPTSSATTSNATAIQTAATSSVYQLTETEVYDGMNRVWKAASADSSSDTSTGSGTAASTAAAATGRWTDVAGRACQAPDKIVADPGKEFVGDWKIVTGSGRDAYGWEYSSQSTSASNAAEIPIRRRTWLRTLQPVSTTVSKASTSVAAVSKATKTTKTNKTTTTKRRSRRQRGPLPQFLLPSVWIQTVQDDFNFKGFGWSFYKSLQFADSVGVALKLPLTYNFDTWERHPALPSIGSAVCVYYPATIILFLNGSMRVEWLKWAAARVWHSMMNAVYQLLGSLVRGLCLAVSGVLYPVTRRLYDPAWTYRKNPLDPQQQQLQQPNYSRTVEEFIGVSVSWRVSISDGYEFRVGYWHYYAPTVVSIWRAVTDVCTRIIPVKTKAAAKAAASASIGSLQPKNSPTQTVLPLPTWFARHSAALGLSTSCPMPDPPHVALTGLLSLSGFYFQKEKASSKKSTPSSSTAGTATSSTSAEISAAMDISDSESETEEVLEEENASSKKSNKKKNVALAATTAIATNKSPWQILREKETAAAALALESASQDKKKDKKDDDTPKKKKNSNKKQPPY
jgi:hypothetical protein